MWLCGQILARPGFAERTQTIQMIVNRFPAGAQRIGGEVRCPSRLPGAPDIESDIESPLRDFYADIDAKIGGRAAFVGK